VTSCEVEGESLGANRVVQCVGEQKEKQSRVRICVCCGSFHCRTIPSATMTAFHDVLLYITIKNVLYSIDNESLEYESKLFC
jgi:hypothetical protein